jgi:NADPH:quinone reductase-like Zn-dependent oxidoreductase
MAFVRGSAEDRAAVPFAVVFDAQGPASWRRSYARLAPTGRLVVYGAHGLTGRGRIPWLRAGLELWRRPRFDPLGMCADNKGVIGFNLVYLFDRHARLRADLGHVLDRLRTGAARLPPTTVVPFAEVALAHRRLESGRTTGKLVLAVTP